MSDAPLPPPTATAPSRRWRKWRLILLAFMVLVVLPASAVTGLFLCHRYQAQVALDEAIAEADRLDPGWRLEDIEKRRTAVPPEENAAVHISAAAALIPNSIVGGKDEEVLYNAEDLPQCQIDAELADTLRKALQPLLPAEALVRKAVPLKTGWHPVKWTPSIIDVSYDHVQDVRKVGLFLKNLAMLQSQDGKHSEAWQTSLTISAVNRSFGEDPLLFTAFVRIGLRAMTVNALERCLAQGTVNDDLLADAQQQLADEGKDRILLFALRGERASFHTLMCNLETGTVRLDDLFTLWKWRGSVGKEFWPYYAGAGFQKDHAWMLRYHNEAVEAAKLPPAEMRAKMHGSDRKYPDGPPLAKLLTPALARASDSAVRTQVLLECAVAGIGVERFRMAHGRWPDSLEEVVTAKLLDKVPIDHFDGRPLRYRKASNGVVVYSVGLSRDYAGDVLDPEKTFDPNIRRVEFRLWDEKHRRQPPRPRPKIDDDKDGDDFST